MESYPRWHRGDGAGRDSGRAMSSGSEIQHTARGSLVPCALCDIHARLEMVSAGVYRAGLELQGLKWDCDLWFANRRTVVWIFDWNDVDGNI